jgi:acetylornithine deacetylase/succinyl-diaminopimelate desuccinylase-like protein
VRTETTLPTCNVTNLTVEPAGEIAVIPVGATARVDFQLVPNQRPQPILELLRTHLHSKGMSDVVIERLPGGYPAVHTPFEHPFIAQIGAAGERVFGSPLLMLPQGPFTQPLYFFTKAFGLPVAAVGCARPDSAPSAPNEHIALDDLISHGQLLIELLHACARNLAPAQQQAGE